MASESLRKRAGAAGIQAAPEDEPKNKRSGSRKTLSAEEQAKILTPEILRVLVQRGDDAVAIVVPTEFTLGQIIDRRVMDDIEMYARLVLLEARKLTPDEVAATDLFKKENLPYLEIAFLASNVKALFHRLVTKVARVEGAEDEEARVSVSESESMSTRDCLFLSVWFFRRWLEEVGKRKNLQRTT